MLKLLSVFVVVVLCCAAATEVVNVTNCNDRLCRTGCQSQSFKQDVCLRESGTSDTVELECFHGPSVCATIHYFNDAACNSTRGVVTNVCGSCQNNYTISCGAIAQGVFFVYNCSDTACQDCGGAKIVPFNKCFTVFPGLFVIIDKVFDCKSVNFKTFASSDRCSGTPFVRSFPDGYCASGSMLQCVNTTSLPQSAGKFHRV